MEVFPALFDHTSIKYQTFCEESICFPSELWPIPEDILYLIKFIYPSFIRMFGTMHGFMIHVLIASRMLQVISSLVRSRSGVTN